MRRLICLMGILVASTGRVDAGEMAYVIKVTPALVYLDTGTEDGVETGDSYLILREEDESYAQVGEVRVVRLFAEFSIAEITYTAEGETIEVLQRAMPRREWEGMAEPVEALEEEISGADRPPISRRSLFLIGGGEWQRETGLRWNPALNMTHPEKRNGVGIGLRLSSAVNRRWRLNLTYRLGLDSDVIAAGIEGDLHLLFKGCDRSGPYVGVGGGLQYLTWDAPGQQRDSTNKFGFNGMVGLQFTGRWNLLIEGGYQRVLQWDDLIDVSNIRTYLGVGRSF